MAGSRNAAIFVFVVDGARVWYRRTWRRRSGAGKRAPVIVAINKADDKRAKAGAPDFYELDSNP